MDIILLLAGIFFGLVICIAILMVILPIYAAAGIFVNKPNGLEKSGIHFFTKIAPGEVKIIVRGKTPVRMVMNTSGKKFAGTGSGMDRQMPAYWELEDGETEDPTADVFWLIRPWAKLVYNMTGAVFTGIYPFQQVYEYELERTVIERKEEGRVTGSNLTLRVKHDISDHFRTRQFLFPVHVTEAETRDKIPLDIIGVAELEVTNPHKAAFGTDRWDHAIINLVTDTVTDETKQMRLDEALTAEDDEEAKRIAKAVEKIEADEIECGIDINTFRTLEINPALDEEGRRAIQAEAIALQKAKGTRIDGKARADVLRDLNKANEEGGASARLSMETEGLVRAAEAAGKNGGSVILMPGNGQQNSDPTQVAILAELKKFNNVSKGRK